jgi:hypothetical protein
MADFWNGAVGQSLLRAALALLELLRRVFLCWLVAKPDFGG